MNMLLFLVVEAVLALSSFVAALPDQPQTNAPSIEWSNCSASDPPGVQCGRVSVPLSYTHHGLGTVELGMLRLSAPRSARLGTLFFNPGGPGTVASDYVLAAATEEGSPNFGHSVLQRYDIIGLDPRGVGLSQPVRCDPSIFNERVSSFPATEEEFQRLKAHNEALGKSCAKLTGPLIDHLDTVNVARDMELVRRAIHSEAKLNFLGLSYGSQIGLTYAEIFPENIHRMALDGILDHTQSETTTLNDEATTYELTLNQFFAWCNTTVKCTLHGQDAASVYESVIRAAEEQPISAPSCVSLGDNACRSDVTGEEVRSNVQILLLFQNATAGSASWVLLSAAIAQAAQGNATLLSSPLATSETFGAYPGIAIGCQDWLHESTNLADLRYKISMASTTAPQTRGTSQSFYYQTNCLGWPPPTTNPQRRLRPRVSEAPVILLVNALYDPATSIVWATEIQSQVANSVLLTRSGSGHTSYQLRGDAAGAIDAFLVDGILPQQATLASS
ncbi:MAG: hypothetical protein LQ342_004486 [Letrouitia transgressa]|nr:MAG: hypothetical protein LQ342_004486 [Letrouitia transgressa]